jgi:hypothetical protein
MPVKGAETIYHEGKAHIEYKKDKGELTGTASGEKTEHQKYGTDGVSPVKKGGPAETFIKQANEQKKKDEEEK